MNFRTLSYLFIMTLSATTLAADKKLPPCPSSPNCVSSQAADDGHFIEPFKILADADEAWVALKQALLSQSRTVITNETANTLHAEATSLVFRFVDDVDAILDRDAKTIHIRSASRIGYGDFGVNRRRIETLRAHMQQARVIE